MVESENKARTEQPKYAPEREVRHAVVMYGGVSLAIYMYGVAEELHHLVCSTARDANDPDSLRAPISTEEIYRDVARVLSDGEVKTRFVVDIISGTSAGGINGICLAKALARDASIAGLKDVWLQEGDFSALLNDEESGYELAAEGRGAAIAGLEYSDPPASLLSGSRMQRTLVDALAEIGEDSDESTPSPLVDELDLWVTTTDLAGLPVKMRLANATAGERRHAQRFHFRYAPKHDGQDDFGKGSSAFLGYAARSSSAFPFAFEPAVLDKLEPFAGSEDWAATKLGWGKFHRAYHEASPEFAMRAFSDGGILDNKPFTYATEALLTRRADIPVDRKLLYIEPDPAHAAALEDQPADPWSAIRTARAATLQIPQVETIREDIVAVLARNRQIERIRDVMSHIELSCAERERLRERSSLAAAAAWAQATLADDALQYGTASTYSVYYRLKVRSVVDWLAGVLVAAAGFDADSDEALAVHQIVRAWKKQHYCEKPSADDAAPPRLSDNAFLAAYDLPYRRRRLDFVLQKFKELTGPDATRVFQSAGVDPPNPDAAPDGTAHEAVRTAIDAARDALLDAERALLTELIEPLQAVGLTREHLTEILAGGDDAAMLGRASLIVRWRLKDLDVVATVIAARVRTAADNAYARLEEAIAADTGPLGDALRVFSDTFEAYDLALYPLTFGTALGETNPVEIVRISPLDAKGPLTRARTPLKGAALHHFGAFLDEQWRSYDIVWGRLDAAECLIGALLGPEHAEMRAPLVRRAHERILAEYAQDLLGQTGAVPESEAIAWFEAHEPPDAPDERRTLKGLKRSQRVLGKLLVDALGLTEPTETSRAVTPVIAAPFNDASRLGAIAALVRARWVFVVLVALISVFAVGLGLVLLRDDADWVGAVLISMSVAPLVLGVLLLYWGLGRLRRGLDKVMFDAVRPQSTAE